MPPDHLDVDQRRRSLRRRIASRSAPVVLFAEPGAGARWLMARLDESVEVSRRRSRADVVVPPFEFDAPRSPARALLRRWHDASPHCRAPLSAAQTGLLARASGGLVAAVRALARRAAEIGVELVEAEIGARRLSGVVDRLRPEIQARLRGLAEPSRLAWATLSHLEAPAGEEALRWLVPGGSTEVERLHDRGLVRRVERGWWVPPPIAAVARGDADRARRGRSALAGWGERLYEAAHWEGRPAALAELTLHAESFAFIASGDDPPTTRAGAALAWLVIAQGTPAEARAEGHAMRALGDLPPRAPLAVALRHAIAEARRGHGRRAAVSALLQGCEDDRANLVRARAAFNAGRAEVAKRLLGRVQRSRDPRVAAGAWLTRAYVERDRGHADAAFAAARESIERYSGWDGERWILEAQMCASLVHLELGRAGRARALLGDTGGSAELTRVRGAMADLPPTRRGAYASYVALARELEGRYDDAAPAIELALGASPPPLFDALWRTYAGRIELGRGRVSEARLQLDAAAATLRSLDAAPSLSSALALVALAAAFRDEPAAEILAEASSLAGPGPRRRIVDLVRRAVGVLAEHRTRAGEPAEPIANEALRSIEELGPRPRGEHDSLHLRAAWAVVHAIVQRRAAELERHEEVRFDDETRSFTFRGGTVCLARRDAQWRVLGVLADAGGAVVPERELIARVWGEGLVGDSGRNRLRVSISHLRGAGLRGAIVRTGGGYALVRARSINSQD